MQGDCEGPVPTALKAADVEDLKPKQCVVKLEKPFIHVKSGGIWLDNLLFYEDGLDFALVSQLELPSDLYLTNCTFQGTSGLTGGPTIGGLLAKNSYAEGKSVTQSFAWHVTFSV